jgi:hypothetical protein
MANCIVSDRSIVIRLIEQRSKLLRTIIGLTRVSMSSMLADHSRKRSTNSRRCETTCLGQDGDMCNTSKACVRHMARLQGVILDELVAHDTLSSPHLRCWETYERVISRLLTNFMG